MPRYFLSELSIEGFRGINNEGQPLVLRFDPNSVNSVFAVNALGKSSLFEALHYLIHGDIPKLMKLQAKERPKDYYCNLFHSGQRASIQAQFQPDDQAAAVLIEVVLDAKGNRTVRSPSGHSDPEGFLLGLQEEFALLDYSTFSRFIEDSPLERGRTFSTLLGFSEYSDCRQSLKAAGETRALNTDLQLDVLQERITSAQTTQIEAATRLKQSYVKVSGKTIESLRCPSKYGDEVVATLAREDILKPLLTDAALASLDFDELRTKIHKAEGGKERQELTKTVQGLIALEALSSHDLETIKFEQQELKKLIEARDLALSKTQGDLLKRLYEAANEVVSKNVWEDELQCPLCESALESPITEHIKHQLDQYSEAAEKGVELNKTWVSSKWRDYVVALESTSPLVIEEEQKQSSPLSSKFASGEISIDKLDNAVNWTKSMVEFVEKTHGAWSEKKDSLQSKLPDSLVELTEKVEHANSFRTSLDQYLESDHERRTLEAHSRVRERWKNFLARAESIFSEAESNLTTARIHSIESQYKSMFQEIMQDANVVPSMQRVGRRENLNIDLSNFHGHNKLSAKALLSESYRNALAIAIFLAAALKHSGAPRFVVLDDVTSSFDAGHQYHLMELIRQKLQQRNSPDGLQFIILSHDGLLKKYFDRLGSTSDWQHHTLEGLPPTGAVLLQTEGADRLKARITSSLSAR